MSRFLEKSVLITGASRGLGRQLALDFGAEGAKVAVNYLSSECEARETVSMIKKSGGESIACRSDITLSHDVKEMVDTVISAHGGIDILINNAGISIDSPFLNISEDSLNRTIAVNLKGPFLVSQAVARSMMTAKRGRIINISATTAVQARRGNANYAISKAGLNMLTQCMALELGPYISVNSVALGYVDSPLVHELFSKDEIRRVVDLLPAKRMTTLIETSEFVRMLASDNASYITGQTIPFDGGRVMR